MAINLAELAFLSWQVKEEQDRQRIVVTARRYHEGDHDTFLTDRLREFLNARDEHEFNLNVCRTVIDVMTERLLITGADTNEPGSGDEAANRPLADWADDLFDQAGLGILQDAVHEGALRDGQHFVIVDWDDENARPRFIPHQRFADPSVDGDGFGCKVHYPDDDVAQPPLFASKRWIEKLDTKGKTRSRQTLYFPDRVEKYELAGQDWAPFRDEGDTSWPIPWVDNAGRPLGIPVIHFPNTLDLRPEAWDAIPIQKAINKALLDLLGAADMTGFRIFIARGWIPTTDGQPPKADGSNEARIAPATILGTTRDSNLTAFDAIDGSDLGQLIETINSLISWFSIVTSTPASRVTFTRMVSSEGTLKQQNEGLFAKIRKRQQLYNMAWINAFVMARRLANHFGNMGLPEEPAFVMRWEPIQARDTKDEQNGWKIKREIGVPLEIILAEMGYSPEEIEQIKATEEWQARMGLMQTGLANTQADTDDEEEAA